MTDDPGDVLAAAYRRSPVGTFRRAFRISAEGGRVLGEMEDDVHHFAVELAGCGGRIDRVAAIAHRTPWTMCAGSALQLETLKGMTVAEVRGLAARERAEHCMHLFDLAVLAAAHLGRDGFAREYATAVDHDADPPMAVVWRDGCEVLRWGIADGHAVGSRFDGAPLSGLPALLDPADPDEAEAALVLRRVSLISFVRRIDLDRIPDSITASPRSPANCYVKQAGRREAAVRNVGSSVDFFGTGRWPLGAMGGRTR